MFDRVQFYLWPLYATTSVNDQKSQMILWPLYTRTQGPDEERFRIFPFYGRSETVGIEQNRFIMWPLYTSVQALSERGGEGFVLFPLWPDRCASSENPLGFASVFPIFHAWISARYMPWPFVQWAEGTVDKQYLWPIVGRKNKGSSQWISAWPIITWMRRGMRTRESAATRGTCVSVQKYGMHRSR